jgi:pimeloyl-ACP methyl ester carboxylesterase
MRYFTPDGIRLAYDVVGAGPPLILHTGAGGDSRMWREAGYVDGLHGYEVILLDHRGHGASDAPADPAAYGIEQYVADVVGLADELGHERFAFWDYSNGGRVGYALAAAHTDRVTALVASPAWLQAILVDETDAEVVARELDGFAHWSPWTVFPRVAAPTLIVAGEQEAEHVEDAAARIPRGRSSVLPGLGHVGAFVSSSLVLPHVRSFLEVCTHD